MLIDHQDSQSKPCILLVDIVSPGSLREGLMSMWHGFYSFPRMVVPQMVYSN